MEPCILASCLCVLGISPGILYNIIEFQVHTIQYYYIRESVDSLCRDGADAQNTKRRCAEHEKLPNSRVGNSKAFKALHCATEVLYTLSNSIYANSS